ncbi:hypothetical protein ACEUZ9_001072 [Paracoccus litorisediminis]
MSKCALATLFFLALAIPAQARIDANISFSPSVINAGATSRATITLQNSDVSMASAAALSMSLPDGLLQKGGGNLVNGCGGSAGLASSGNILSLTLGGGTIPAASSGSPGNCAISFDVTAHRAAVLAAEIPAGAVSASVGGVELVSGSAAQASLTSTMTPLALTLSTSFNAQLQGDETGWRNIRIANSNAVAVTGIQLPINLSVSGTNFVAGDLVSNSCGGHYNYSNLSISHAAEWGDFTLSTLSNGAIAANSSCDLRFKIKPRRKPQYTYFLHNTSSRMAAGLMSSDQGVSNALSNDHWATNRSGIETEILVNGATSAVLDVSSGETAEITYSTKNHNIFAVPGVSILINIPSGLTVVTSEAPCGSLTQASGGLRYDFTQTAAPDQVTGYQTGDCLARITVKANSGGSHSIATTNQWQGSTAHGPVFFAGNSISIEASLSTLAIETSFDKNEVYASDSAHFKISLQNKSASQAMNSIQITNRVAAEIYGAIIGPSGMISNGCGGNASIPMDRSSIMIDSFSLAPGAVCDMTWQVRFGSAAYKTVIAPPFIVANRFTPSDISYQLGSGARENWGVTKSISIALNDSAYLFGTFTPYTALENSISRLEIQIEKRSIEGNGLRDIWINQSLSGGIRIAPVPNFSSTCGGHLVSQPGDSFFNAVGGSLAVPLGAEKATCSFFVNTLMPDMAEGESAKVIHSLIYSDAPPVARRSYGAQDIGLDGFSGQSYHRWQKNASVYVGNYNLDLGLAFADASLGGSGSTRVAVTLSNLANIGLNLTGLRLPIDLSGSGVKLAAVPDPKFTVKTGAASACTGAQFIAVPGATSIEINSANISAQAVCVFEFTVAAASGGNHVISIPAFTAHSAEGITNASGVSATLTVGYLLSGGIGFDPNLIGETGITDFIIEIVNTNPADPSGAYQGANPAVSYSLPAYAIPAGSPDTTCPGGTVSLSGNVLRLDGGDFPGGSSCSVSLPVSISNSGAYSASLPAGALRASDGTTNTAAATSAVKVLKAPILSLGTVSPMTGIGRIGTINAVIRNPNTAALNPEGLSGLTFHADLDADISPVENAITSTCSGFSYDLPAGNGFTARNISLAAGTSCIVALPATSNMPGDHDTQIGDLAVAEFPIPTNPDIPARLRFASNPTVIMRPTGPAPDSEIPFGFEVEITNPNSFAIGLTSFTLPLPASPGLLLLASPGTATGCGGALALGAAGAASTGLSGGNLPGNGSCFLSMNLVTPKAGNYSLTPTALQLEYGALNLTPTTITVLGSSAEIQATRTMRVLADQVADLAACAALDPASAGRAAVPGACIEVTVTIRNPSSELKTARDLMAREAISANMDMVSIDKGSFTDITMDEGVIQGKIDTIAPGESRSFNYRGLLN